MLVRTSLRFLIERMSNGVSIECCTDETIALVSLINREAKHAGILLSADAREALLVALRVGPQAVLREITMLMLYSRGHQRLEATDVEAVLSGSFSSAVDDLVDRSLLRDLYGTTISAAHFFGKGVNSEQLMLRLTARLVLLHRVRIEVDKGRSFEASCRTVFEKLPNGALQTFTKEVERWASEAICERLPRVRAASARARIEYRLNGSLTARMLWTMASSPLWKPYLGKGWQRR